MITAAKDHAESISRILRLAIRLHAPDVYPEHLWAALKSRAVGTRQFIALYREDRCRVWA